MSIVKGTHTTSKLRGSAMPRSNVQRHRAINILRRRSSQPFPESAVSKHLYLRDSLFLLLVSSLFARSPIRRSAALAIAETTQESVPNDSKFKHDNLNHSRLPCLYAIAARRIRRSPCCQEAMATCLAPVVMLGSSRILPARSARSVIRIRRQARETVSAIEQLQHEIRSRAPHENERRWLYYLSSTFACRRGDDNSCGLNAHVTCYQCHGPQAKSGDRNISTCGVCHEPGRNVRTRETAPAFRVGFSHAKHDKSEGLTCNECHRVRIGVAQRLQVTPQPLNHHAAAGAFSCMSCHNGKRAFGGDDFSVCTRCHTRTTWHF